MRHSSYYLFLLILISSAIDLRAQDNNKHTLLWRIQKEGVEKPSFLFGTMHVTDKKAFNFQDSLYIYLQRAEAFALELNPDSANQVVAAYMSGELSQEKDDWSDRVVPRDLERIKKVADKDVKSIALKEDRGDLISYFVNRLINNEKKQTESMNTFMDAFLYEMAWQQDKKIFGLEELEGKAEVLKALSKGLKTRKIDNLLDKWDPSADESPVNRFYFKEDIDSIDLFFNEFFTESALKIFLYDRNEVMANRMDSIMQGQTLFAAMGSAHLPGSKGVIALLRKKGYIVEPVFSEKRIHAEEYQVKNPKRNWQLLKNEEYGFQYQLPGSSKTQEVSQTRKIVYHYDIGGGSIFMTIFGNLSSDEKKKNINEIITAHLDKMILNGGGGRVISKKPVIREGLKGIEAVCLYNDNSLYRYQEIIKDNLFYVLSVGSEKKDNLYNEKAEQYFGSFKLMPIPKTNWSSFLAPVDGFSILFPGKPAIEVVPLDKETAATIAMKNYSYFDANSGISYSITSGKTLAGNNYLDGDNFFQSYIDHIKLLSQEEPFIADTIISECSAKSFITKSPDVRIKGFVIKRSNTSYFVTVEYEPGNEKEASADKFLTSFIMTSFSQPVWTLQRSTANQFTAWLPGQIQEKKQDSTAYDFKANEKWYYGYDPYASISYNVEVYPINKYYWAAHTDSIYSYWKNKVMNEWNDSLLSFSDVKNGGLIGKELLVINKTSKARKVIRLLLNGHSMYVLTTTLPGTHIDNDNTKRFFAEFRATNEETATSILENNADKLFNDLLLKDSLGFQQAYSALAEVQFGEKDIVVLMEKATLQYPKYENNYQSVNEQLLSQVETLLKKYPSKEHQDQVNAFIAGSYQKENKSLDSVRFYLLGLVAWNKTMESYQMLKELLATKKPAADYNYRLFGKLYDSLELTKTLYPELLNYLNDTIMGLSIVSLTKTLVDSNQLEIDSLTSVKGELIKLAKRHIKKASKADYEFAYELPPLIELLGCFKQKDADDVVANFLKAKEIYVKKSAAISLIKNNKPVPASVLSAIGDDQQYRVSLYEELKKLEKEKLFPADLRSQVSLAEGYIANAVYDEEEGETTPELIFIKKIDYNYKGAKKFFYIFRANYKYEADDEEDETNEEDNESEVIDTVTAGPTTESYLSVAGPFDPNKNKLPIEEKENVSGIWYDDKFDGMKTDYFFRKYIERSLKWQEEQKK